MKISILFFGATADTVGERRLSESIADGATVGTALDSIVGKFPGLSRHSLLIALNEEYTGREAVLNDGDELAIFTAVSGG